MSEIFFRAVSNVHTDPARDKASSYKKGYPVDALPDGQSGGKEVIPPGFITVHCPEITVKQAREYLNPIIKDGKVECRRQFYISEADVDTVLALGGEITLTKAQLLSKFQNKLSE